MKVAPRILWLTEDEQALGEQISGKIMAPEQAASHALHYGVNTDAMISGAACTLGYTPEILGPHFLHNFKEKIDHSSILDQGFEVIVGGEAYGSGSSREAAVVAHLGAGIKLVVAKSFQRIFQENMVYVGLPFTTDVSILDKIITDEGIDVDALFDKLPPFFQAVAKSGGLMAYGTALLDGTVVPSYGTEKAPDSMNCIEKIIATQAWLGEDKGFGLASVAPGDQVLCQVTFRGMHEYTGAMVMDLYLREWPNAPLFDPDNVAAFEDHFVLIDSETVPLSVKEKRLIPARKLRDEMIEVCDKHGVKIHGPGQEHDAGVCHRIVVEQYAQPGTIVVLTDSHTPTAGVMNAFAFGVGSTAMAFALRTGLIPVTVPKTVRVWVEGKPRGVLSAKDLILHLIGDPYFREEKWRESPTDTCVAQFGGPGLNSWNVDELSVLTNMTVEGGLMTGIIEPCEPILEFLNERRGNTISWEKKFVYPDADARYTHTITINLDKVPLSVATPGDSRNRRPLSEVADTPIHNVVIASCTGGSLADLRAAHAVLQQRSLAPSVRLTVTPSSATVFTAAESEGLLARFRALGAVVTEPGCGSCIGNGPGIPLPGETTASTTNRNFDRRMGAPGPVYLVSPAVAAASAVAGKLIDPRNLT
jgi:3-isopropylmalate/(R)-2-methylmalate dehydratase large subunit